MENGTRCSLYTSTSRVIVQEDTRWPPTAEARVLSQFMSCGIGGGQSSFIRNLASTQLTSCGISGEQSGNGAGFVRVLRFPLPILTPPTNKHIRIILSSMLNCLDNKNVSKQPENLMYTTHKVKKWGARRNVR
jgi:hypothetical protein